MPDFDPNDPCPCGSGLEYRHCCLHEEGPRDLEDRPVTPLGEVAGTLDAWIALGPFAARREELFETHVAAVCQSACLSEGQLGGLLGESVVTAMSEWILEDFMTVGEGDDNVVNAFLARAGARETPAQREYLEALRDSRPGLYAVVEVYPGHGLMLTDLLIEGPSLEVRDELRSNQLEPGQCVACRLIQIQERLMVAGAVLHFDPAWAEQFVAFLHDTVERAYKELSRSMKPESLPRDFVFHGVLYNSASMISDAFAIGHLKSRRRPRPVTRGNGHRSKPNTAAGAGAESGDG